MSAGTRTAKAATIEQGASMREMKVRIPIRIVTALHSRKLLTGEGIGSIVLKAVQKYFEETQRSPGTQPPEEPR